MSREAEWEAAQTLLRYLRAFPEESDRFQLMTMQLAAGEDLCTRNNMTGHLTSSACVVNRTGSLVLMVDHLFLQRMLPPGGHYEPPGTLMESALREVLEETGVSDARPHAWTETTGLPLDIDSHSIPENLGKNEGPHVHHDFQFLAVSEQVELQAQVAEVRQALWAPVEALRDSPDSRLRRVYRKLQALQVIP